MQPGGDLSSRSLRLTTLTPIADIRKHRTANAARICYPLVTSDRYCTFYLL